MAVIVAGRTGATAVALPKGRCRRVGDRERRYADTQIRRYGDGYGDIVMQMAARPVAYFSMEVALDPAIPGRSRSRA